MRKSTTGSHGGPDPWRNRILPILGAVLLAILVSEQVNSPVVRAQEGDDEVQFGEGINPEQWYRDHEIEHTWEPDYLDLATGDPDMTTDHEVYAWPFALDSIGWSMQSYQDYGGTPYFHHGMDMMKMYGTQVYNRSGGQVINIENYNPGWDLYWEVAVLDPDGYIWQYHHIQMESIPQYIWDKWEEWQVDPVNGGFVPADTHIGNIIEWPVWSYGKQFNHIHLNILAAGGVYVNGFEFHDPLPDTVGPEIQAVGLLQNGQIVPGNTVTGNYSLYVRTRDLILDDVYYLPPWEITFAVDCGPVETTWRFDTLPGGANRYAYLDDFYVVPPTCGDYGCRNYYIDLGFIRDSQFNFPTSGGEHTILVTVRDYAGNIASQLYTYTVVGPPNSAPIALPQSVSTLEDIPIDIHLIASDPDHDPLAYTVILPPTHGLLTGLAPDLTYTPTENYYGGDSISFIVNDCEETSAPATVEINVVSVNDNPVADSQTVETFEELPVNIILTGSDPENDPLFFTLVTTPTHGTLTGTPPNLVYTPANNLNGIDSFAFVVNDGQLPSEPAEVSIEVIPVNDPPVAYQQSITTLQNFPVNILLTGFDVDGDALTFNVVDQPSHGTLEGAAAELIYSPVGGFAGSDSFSFVVTDGWVESTPAVVGITVNRTMYIPIVSR